MADEKKEKAEAARRKKKEREEFFGDQTDSLAKAVNWRSGQETDSSQAGQETFNAAQQKVMNDDRCVYARSRGRILTLATGLYGRSSRSKLIKSRLIGSERIYLMYRPRR